MNDLPGAPFVAIVQKGEQVADRESLGPLDLDRARDDVPQRRFVQLPNHAALRVDALRDAVTPPPRRKKHRRFGIGEQIVERRPPQAPELQHVLETLGGQDREARALALEQGIGPDRRAVHESLHLRPRAVCPRQNRFHSVQDALHEVDRRRRNLGHLREAAIRGRHDIGERAAHVHTNPVQGFRGMPFLIILHALIASINDCVSRA